MWRIILPTQGISCLQQTNLIDFHGNMQIYPHFLRHSANTAVLPRGMCLSGALDSQAKLSLFWRYIVLSDWLSIYFIPAFSGSLEPWPMPLKQKRIFTVCLALLCPFPPHSTACGQAVRLDNGQTMPIQGNLTFYVNPCHSWPIITNWNQVV